MTCHIETSRTRDGSPWSMWYCCQCQVEQLNYALTGICYCGHQLSDCYPERSVPVYISTISKSKESKLKASRRSRSPKVQITSLDEGVDIQKEDIFYCNDTVNILGKSNYATSSDQSSPTSPWDMDTINPVVLRDSSATSSPISLSESSCSSCTGTPFSTDSECELHVLIEERAEYLAHRSLNQFHIMYDTVSGNFTCTAGGNPPEPSSGQSFSLAVSMSTATKTDKAGKRSLNDGSRSANEEEDDEGDDRNKRPRGSNSHREQPEYSGPPFACIYLKHNPAKYMNWQSCKDKSFPSVHRMKAHLYRWHCLFKCPRCFETFQKKAKLDNHLRFRTGCEIRNAPLTDVEDGIDEDKCKQLHSRVGLSFLDEPSKWECAYRIVFGQNITRLPSPYFDRSELNEGKLQEPITKHSPEFLNYCRQELRRRAFAPIKDVIRQYLYSVTENETDLVDQSLNVLETPIMDRITAVFTDVVENYKQQDRSDLDAAPLPREVEFNSGPGTHQSSAVYSSPFSMRRADSTMPTLITPPPDFNKQFEADGDNPIPPPMENHVPVTSPFNLYQQGFSENVGLVCPPPRTLGAPPIVSTNTRVSPFPFQPFTEESTYAEPSFPPPSAQILSSDPQSSSFFGSNDLLAEGHAPELLGCPYATVEENRNRRMLLTDKGLDAILPTEAVDLLAPGGLVQGLSSSQHHDTAPLPDLGDDSFGNFGLVDWDFDLYDWGQ